MPSSFVEHYCAPLKHSSLNLRSALLINSENQDATIAKQRLQKVLTSLDKSRSQQIIREAVQLLQELNPEQEVADLTTLEGTKDIEQEALELTLLNQLVVGLYAESLDMFLQQSVQAEKEAQWWDNVARSNFRIWLYLLQTFPLRAWNVSYTISRGLQANNLSLSPSHLTPRSLSNLFPSRGLLHPSALITSAFPHLHHNPQFLPLIFFPSLPSHSEELVNFKSGLHFALESLKNTLNSICYTLILPYHYTRQECLSKKKELESIRDNRACTLGKLAQMRQTLQRGLEKQEKERGTSMKRFISTLQLGKEKEKQGRDESALMKKFISELDEVVSASGVDVDTDVVSSSPKPPSSSVIAALSTFSSSTLQFHLTRHNVLLRTHQLLRPSRYVRLWPQALFGPPLIYYALTSIYQSRKSLQEFALDTKQVVKGFLVDWLIEPLKGVIDTVRSKDDSGVGVIVSPEGVAADYQSLERMSLALAKEKLHYGSEQLEELSQRIKVGDLTPILKLYEEDIRSPLRNALRGTLVRTVLIQVQKAKVDIDQALAGIDRLLKSQELTFAFVGVAPAIVVVYSLGSYLRSLLGSGRGAGRYGGKQQRERIFFVMRRIERLLVSDRSRSRSRLSLLPIKPNTNPNQASAQGVNLNANNNNTGTNNKLELTSLTAGLLLLSISQLRTFAETYLPAGSRIREGFLEDVDDLQDPEFDANERLRVVERMWRSWGGVFGWGGRGRGYGVIGS
ncbi:hypothetical protein D9758_002786 [Tetrapyrgos nigripes]|uniref:NCA2-domain-containing protein n=1 Tax=Tetrapyrgos nigripes TaxID=182062 RepID=A0A8H5LTX1_9AGAR|nr:hypothetical protein D9758_002786 [Tetrapyrgos nigripes]